MYQVVWLRVRKTSVLSCVCSDLEWTVRGKMLNWLGCHYERRILILHSQPSSDQFRPWSPSAMSRYLLLGVYLSLLCLSALLMCTFLTVDVLTMSCGDINAFLAKIMLSCSTPGACLGRFPRKGVLPAASRRPLVLPCIRARI